MFTHILNDAMAAYNDFIEIMYLYLCDEATSQEMVNFLLKEQDKDFILDPEYDVDGYFEIETLRNYLHKHLLSIAKMASNTIQATIFYANNNDIEYPYHLKTYLDTIENEIQKRCN